MNHIVYAYDERKNLSAFRLPEDIDIHDQDAVESFKSDVREELNIDKNSRVFILVDNGKENKGG